MYMAPRFLVGLSIIITFVPATLREGISTNSNFWFVPKTIISVWPELILSLMADIHLHIWE